MFAVDDSEVSDFLDITQYDIVTTLDMQLFSLGAQLEIQPIFLGAVSNLDFLGKNNNKMIKNYKLSSLPHTVYSNFL